MKSSVLRSEIRTKAEEYKPFLKDFEIINPSSFYPFLIIKQNLLLPTSLEHIYSHYFLLRLEQGIKVHFASPNRASLVAQMV